MKPVMKPINKCSAIELLSMIAYKMKLCKPKVKLGELSIVVKSQSSTFCLIADDKPTYIKYDDVDEQEPLCVAVRYASPLSAVNIVAHKLLKLIHLHADPSLGSDDVLLVKVDFSSAPEKMLVQYNNEQPICYNAKNVLFLV